MNLANDDRSDDLYSAYGQVEYKITPQVRLVAAGRFDDGDLIDAQFSPKGAVVYSPNENHSFRVSVNQAFQTPNYSEFFLQVPVAAPTAAPRQLEGGIEQYYAALQAAPLPPGALAGLTITNNLPWNFSPATNALALGNSELEVETVTGWELGYKGTLSEKVYVTADAYINELQQLRDRPAAGRQSGVPQLRAHRRRERAGGADRDRPAAGELRSARRTIRSAPRSRCCSAAISSCRPAPRSRAATRSPRCPTAAARSCSPTPTPARSPSAASSSALGYQFTPEFRGDVSFTGFDFDVDEDEQAAGDQLLPNTPSKKATFSVSYAGQQGFDGNVTVRLVDGYAVGGGHLLRATCPRASSST